MRGHLGSIAFALLLATWPVTARPAVQSAPTSSAPAPTAEVARAEELRGLARAAQTDRDFATAVRYLDEARAIAVRLGDARGEALASSQLGAIHQLLQDRPRATTELLRARELLRTLGDEEGLLGVYDRLMYSMPGGPEKDALRTEALVIARRASSRNVECNILHQWGDQLFNQGLLANAFATLRDALACIETTPDLSRTGRVLVSIGRVYRAHGRLPHALEQYTRALALQEQAHDEEASVQSINAIAVTLGMMGRTDEALARYREGLDRARKTKAASLEVAMLGNLGGAYLNAGRYGEAIDLLEQALATEREPMLIAVRTRQLALAYQGVGELERAHGFADKAVALANSFDTRLLAFNTRAQVRIAEENFVGASDDLRMSLDIVESARSQTIPSDFMKRGFSDANQRTSSTGINLLMLQKRDREALELAERARGRAFLDLLATRSAGPPSSTPGPMPTGAEPMSSQAPPIPSDREGAPASVDDITALARRLESTFVIYWVDEASTFVWIVAADGTLTAIRIPLSLEQITDLVNAATGVGDGSVAGSTMMLSSRAGRRPWRDLYDRLVRPVRDALPTTKGSRLTIVPHGPLFGLSFASLVDEQNRYLIESYELHYVPAVAVLRYTTRPSGTPVTDRALLVGDPGALPTLPAEAPLAPLVWAAREIDAVKGMVGREPTVLSGVHATKSQVRQGMAGRTLIHVASHAIVRRDEALASYLALGPDSGFAREASTSALRASTDKSADKQGVVPDDGRLTADEVYGLSLDADLVVLSGCRTALGAVGGDGVMGFTRAFLYAGASSVVATMWEVSDRTTYEVMKAFYVERKRGRGKAAALRDAQLAVIAALRKGAIMVDGRPLPESPQLWAGFALVGEP